MEGFMKFNKHILLIMLLCIPLPTSPMGVGFKAFLRASRNSLNAWSKATHTKLAVLKSQPKFRLAVGAVATLGIAGSINYKYPAFLDPCRNKFAHVRFTLTQPKKTSLWERERINRLLDQHSDDIKTMFYSRGLKEKDRENKTGASHVPNHPEVVEFPWLPGYFIKTDPTRVEGARTIDDCIQKYKLRHVGVAEKWLYTPSAHLSQEPLVVAKKVEFVEGGSQINLKQAKDLCCVLRNAKYQGRYHYWDFSGGNLAPTPDGRLVFFDTESSSFVGFRDLGEPFIRLRRMAQDKETAQFFTQQLAEVDPVLFVSHDLNRRIGLLHRALIKLGCYEQEQAKNEIRKDFQRYVPSLDKEGVAEYERLLNQHFEWVGHPKSNPEHLTQEQRTLIAQLFKENYMDDKRIFEYSDALR
jgi:hypothetical protein